MKLVTNWLNGARNYHVGVAIYKSLGSDKHVLHLLQGPKTPVAENALLQAMQQLLTKPAPAPAASPLAEMPSNTDDVVLKALHDKWLHPYKEMQHLRSLLHKYGNANTEEAINYRKPIAFQILALEQRIMKVWAERAYYLEHGTLPEIKPPIQEVIPSDPLQLANLISNCKRDIRRFNNNLAKNPNAKDAKRLEDMLALHLRITGQPYQFKPKANGQTKV
ncbi:hypothetical protein ACFOW1_01590 [Parasediminibacterium paludis]|uniref:Uncharacterized protein n=1 Tax=Parasediminibacterium paludis TaxID=908966 RepID=A0ABV8PU43_9BACT